MNDLPRVISVVALAVTQVAVGFLPRWLGWGKPIGKRSDDARTPLTPPGWVFAIWGILYLGCAVFALWQAWPSHWDDELCQRVGWITAGLFAANTAWVLYVSQRGLDWGSVLIIVFSAVLAVVMASHLPSAGVPDARTDWTVTIPLLALSGWVSLAAWVNLLGTTQFMRVKGIDTSATSVCLVVLILATLVIGFVAWRLGGGLAYAAPVVWGMSGIVIGSRSKKQNLITIAAAIAGGLVIFVAILGEG